MSRRTCKNQNKKRKHFFSVRRSYFSSGCNRKRKNLLNLMHGCDKMANYPALLTRDD